MLELETAVARILEAIANRQVEQISLATAHGRFIAETIVSPIDLPVFDNSGMDGYAVRSVDVVGASKDSPVRLKIIGKVAAGSNFTGVLAPDSCVRLFTGSPLPKGADAVVMQEDTRSLAEDTVEILDTAKPWENVRFQGEDIKRGAVISKDGEVLSTGTIALLAAVGRAEVQVGRQPIVGLLATGSELVEPGQSLCAGKIYESNRIGLANLVKAAGGAPRVFPIVPDTLEDTTGALRGALRQCDILVTCGGVSVGELDFIKPAFEEIGGKLDFWKVAIKPGRPFVFGQADRKLFFGLPGNPISALVTFVLLVRPALLRWQGAKEIEPPLSYGVLAEALQNSGERRHFVRVRSNPDGSVRSAGAQASHILSSMAAANGLVDVPPYASLKAGELVKVIRWE